MGGVDAGRWDEPILVASVLDLPAVVVQEHVVVAAQKNAVVDVGGAVVAFPVLDVVSLGPTGRRQAVGPPAASITRSECNALSRTVKTLLTAEVQDVVVLVDCDGDCS